VVENGGVTVKPHKGLDGKTPYETLYGYFYDNKLQTTLGILTIQVIKKGHAHLSEHDLFNIE